MTMRMIDNDDDDDDDDEWQIMIWLLVLIIQCSFSLLWLDHDFTLSLFGDICCFFLFPCTFLCRLTLKHVICIIPAWNKRCFNFEYFNRVFPVIIGKTNDRLQVLMSRCEVIVGTSSALIYMINKNKNKWMR